MTRRIATLLLLGGLASLAPARSGAQVFGQYTGGSVVPMNDHVFGAYVEMSGNLFGVVGQLRSSFEPDMDFGFAGGVGIHDFGATQVTAVRLATDLKALVVRRDASVPLDVVVGAGVGLEGGDDLNALRLGPTAIASRGFGPEGDPSVRPYAGLQLLFSREFVRGHRDSGLSIPLHLGTEARLARGLRLAVDVQWRVGHQYGDDIAFSTGFTTAF